MKNIHLQKTDKPSRLKQNKITKKISLVNKGIDLTSYTPINIFIISDEEIKEGDYYIDYSITELVEIHKLKVKFGSKPIDCKKIILTTDTDLISDGVQAIPDEFLEWFVHNPSCEWIEFNYELGSCLNCEWNHDMCPNSEECLKNTYKIIIPKEEPKQETLEEFIDKVDTPADLDQFTFDEGIRVGAKWQQERMYSEEEVLELLRKAHFVEQNIDEWFEQFKKK